MLLDQIHSVWKYKTGIYVALTILCLLLVYSFISTSDTSVFQIGEHFIRTEKLIKADVGDIKHVIRNTYGPDVKIGERKAQVPYRVINFDDEEFKLTLYFKRESADSLWNVNRYTLN